MTNLRKWNRCEHGYDDYIVPDEWHVSCYETDMQTEVNCCQCGQRLPFGETYTSLEVHMGKTGFGYGVCYDCHVAEISRERSWREAS